MSISTPQGGGTRRPSVTKPAAGAKPKPVDDDLDEAAEFDEVEADEQEDVDADARPAAKATKTVGRSTSRARGTTPGTRPDRAAAGTKTVGGTKKAPAAKPVTRPAAKSGAGSRKTFAPVKVSGERNWGPTALFAAVVLAAVAIIGYGGYQVYQNGLTAQQRAARIDGIKDFTKSNKDLLKAAQHQWGPIKYEQVPPIGGPHNQNWQRCMGDVYPAPIASEHAVHAMEHGAVWITYQPNLPADQVAVLAKKVKGNDYMLMSPFEGQDKPISLQVWGYQLKVDKAGDKRIDEFIKALRQQVGPEQGATCSSGDFISETGTTPRDIGKDAAATGQQPGTTGG
jgi:hypothetical protein